MVARSMASVSAAPATRGARALGGDVDVGCQPAQRGHPFRDGLSQHLRAAVRCPAGSTVADTASTGTDTETVAVQQRGQVGDAPRDVRVGEPVGLVEHHHGGLVVPVEGPQILVMDDLVGVLLRIGDPDDQVDQLQQPVHLGPMPLVRPSRSPGRSSSTRPPRLGIGVVGGRPVEPTIRRDAQPLEQAVGAGRRPDGGVSQAGGRAAYADLRQIHPGQPVEQAGLAASGGAGQRDHGVVAGQRQTTAGPRHQVGGRPQITPAGTCARRRSSEPIECRDPARSGRRRPPSAHRGASRPRTSIGQAHRGPVVRPRRAPSSWRSCAPRSVTRSAAVPAGPAAAPRSRVPRGTGPPRS